ncbi:hypothetical protein B0T26DRAFT_856017 [Lasiosphaeria miniovina]|uniref:Gelsolin n=1 Tax=Lasiosphaeria miniovina TaxID=1954250 RepID=A0AA40AM54_9PEZI|nr:uncharacterized protein B0T26DRAFT_856017 [Lasiosphaeria miniovina]KAK0718397.1 hypothetical protein B0T26DRAFT_856017 [Lasiosphaeria miniovina]
MSDEVSDFLRSVELLKGRREEEDEARSRELEEKILQEKRERQARRAERARSISPQKSSPVNTPSPSAQRTNRALATDDTLLTSPGLESSGSPRARVARSSEAMDSTTDYSNSNSPTKENDSPFDLEFKRSSLTLTSPSVGGPPSRSPLSWQRRPPSQASDRPRPLSVVAAENAAARSSPNPPSEPTPAPEQTLTRDQIAQSLAGKDPTWFRQTADRGQNSPAYRRNQVEDTDVVDMSSSRVQLAGMSRSPAAAQPFRDSPVPAPDFSARHSKIGSPLVLSGPQRLDPPTGETGGGGETSSSDRQPALPTSGRTSPSRPVSPTKGMGGFVQSAMMKRSDSVKRWSVTSPGGLQRADSSVSSRGGLEGAPKGNRPASVLRDGSTTPSSRPTSSHEKEPENSTATASATVPDEAAPTEPEEEPEQTTPPVSPSKTMDPRRWSPTKSSSWLEAALNKPESPKPKPTPPPSNQPAWMVELNKAKAQKTNIGSGGSIRSPSLPKKPEIKTGGLLKSTPMGAGAGPVSAGLGGFPRVSPSDKASPSPFRGSFAKPLSRRGSEDPGSNILDGSSDSSALTKTKLETPPVKDFRANLKPRVPPPETGTGKPDELKNVFGNLRRTKTQNYVAPDELKGNILRGKAALNTTGGPQKNERKDEFKDAILKKKEEFKKAQQEGRGVTKGPGSSSSLDEKSIPEGLAKKLEIARTGNTSRQGSTTSITSDSTLDTPQTGLSSRLQSKVSGGGLADRFNPALAGLLARGPPPASGPQKSPDTSLGTPTSNSVGAEDVTGPGPQLTHMTKGRARGPRRKAPTSVAGAKQAEEPKGPEPEPKELQKPSEPVTPKEPRESVKPEVTATSPVQKKPPVTSPKPQKFVTTPTPTPKPETITLVDPRRSLVQETPTTAGESVIPLVDSSKRVSEVEPSSTGRPIQLVDSSIRTRPRSPTKVHEQVAALAAKNQQASKPTEPADQPVSQPPSPKKLVLKRISKFLDDQETPIPRPEPEKSRPSSPIRGRSFPDPTITVPGKQPSKDKADSGPPVSAKSNATLFSGVGLGLSRTAVKPGPGSAGDGADAQTEQSPRLPPKGARPLPPPPKLARTPPRITSPTRSPSRSPSKYSVDVSNLFSDFFGPERPKRRYTADAADILMRRPVMGSTVKTLRTQLFQVFGDGKKLPVPAHHERVLFEREMYLCPHSFTDSAGRKVNEVYFWSGDEVPESALQDAEVFAPREARAFGGKLVRLSQGKETAEFVQALGGIVIVRRGSSNKYDSLAPNMLCGRRYLGQVAFDEVDFSPASLCSGFPYLITQQGKCYLWKGKGSDVDELGCARLVGMDLALMGELLEIEEDNEPDSFWDIFGGGARAPSADHWRLKPNYGRYCGRLFCSNSADRHQISELFPFKQTDLLSSNIYVLDAFFEMYIIVGAQSQHQYAAFRNALDFAQEYAILAAGMEDRPFVPISTVVLEGIPRDLKSVFRKWQDVASPTITNPPSYQQQPQTPGGGSGSGSGNLRRGRSLRIVPLNQALQAVSLTES